MNSKRVKIKGSHKKSIRTTTICMTAVCVLMLFCFASCGKSDSVIPEPDKKGYLVSVTAEKSYTAAELYSTVKSFTDAAGISQATMTALMQDIKVAAITYYTTGVDGKQTLASGIVAYPSGLKSLNTIYSIQHSTVEIDDAPSVKMYIYEMIPAAFGKVVVIADYLGYGASSTSDRQHPFIHATLSGSACSDMLPAAVEYLGDKNIAFSSTALNVILAGYSEGGSATISTLTYMTEHPSELNFNIKAVYAGGGLYDTKTCLDEMIKSGAKYSQMQFIPLLLRGIAYGENLDIDFSNIFSPELMAKGFMNIMATSPFSTWNTYLGTDITKVLSTDLLAYPECNGNSDAQKMYAALMKNSLINCTAPKMAVTLYHSKTDDYIPYANAVSAAAHWSNATLVQLDADKHYSGGVEFLLRVFGVWNLIKK